jgi:hypothetical protein
MADQNFTNWIDARRPTQTLFIALDVISNSDVFIVVPTELLPRAEGYIQLCGKFEENQSLSAYHFYYANSLIPQNAEIK